MTNEHDLRAAATALRDTWRQYGHGVAWSTAREALDAAVRTMADALDAPAADPVTGNPYRTPPTKAPDESVTAWTLRQIQAAAWDEGHAADPVAAAVERCVAACQRVWDECADESARDPRDVGAVGMQAGAGRCIAAIRATAPAQAGEREALAVVEAAEVQCSWTNRLGARCLLLPGHGGRHCTRAIPLASARGER